ncbi:MAG: anthranilate phosphoribosyltransferase [Deltaproteobacteria bacterium]|nr:anthranilate phosphoribosyltransferase [Deltaproteobacteria bacterium]MBW2019804.1 anthranilate phosphoribosyltransferase [Deltaproteobacteria bacterium]MBW2074609.1 anthranilate phosphoribosyltransferase [Deltaproteobacteria bacterium]
MLKQAIQKVVNRSNLSEEEMEAAMDVIMSGQTTPAQIGAFITALRLKGETVEEITAGARVMRRKATRIQVDNTLVNVDRDEINLDLETIIDTCGTGGDGTNTFNVSTTTAFVVAGCGLRVAKHGNRSVSSLCGSADVIERLGVNLDVPPRVVEKCLNQVGIGFLYAPALHGAMKYVIGPRREIGIRTIFNILGPLTNPAGANVQVLGVYKKELTPVLAEVLNKLGSRSAFVVYGEDCLDEISITGKTQVSELKNGQVATYTIEPEDFGLSRASLDDIRGGDAQENAGIVLSVLQGEPGARRDIVLLNAAAALVAAGRAADFPEGIARAAEAIDTGRALEKLEGMKAMTNEYKEA